MPVPVASAACTAASRSADSLGRPKAFPLLVPFARALAMPPCGRLGEPAASILPEPVEPPRIHLGIACRIGDLPVPKISGEGAGIDALVDQLEPCGVPQ